MCKYCIMQYCRNIFLIAQRIKDIQKIDLFQNEWEISLRLPLIYSVRFLYNYHYNLLRIICTNVIIITWWDLQSGFIKPANSVGSEGPIKNPNIKRHDSILRHNMSAWHIRQVLMLISTRSSRSSNLQEVCMIIAKKPKAQLDVSHLTRESTKIRNGKPLWHIRDPKFSQQLVRQACLLIRTFPLPARTSTSFFQPLSISDFAKSNSDVNGVGGRGRLQGGGGWDARMLRKKITATTYISTMSLIPTRYPHRRQSHAVQEAIRFPMLQLNDARVLRIIQGRVGHLDFKGSQAPILCRIILPSGMEPGDHAWNIRGNADSWENRARSDAPLRFLLRAISNYQR